MLGLGLWLRVGHSGSVGGAGPTGPWILETGFWVDTPNVWVDTALWID